MNHTSIEWTDATWNPLRGCSRVSEGCRNCYAERVAYRFSGPGKPYEGLAVLRNGHASWTGKVELVEKHLLDPLKRRPVKSPECGVCLDMQNGIDREDDVCTCSQRPRRIFVNSMSDLFHESAPDEWIDRIFAVMALCPQHVFQVLTKRPHRMLEYFNAFGSGRVDVRASLIGLQASPIHLARTGSPVLEWSGLPMPNVWLGVSVENQATADERIPLLLRTPAAVRFLSCEPLLGAINFRRVPEFNRIGLDLTNWWVIAGGESGPGARPMHPDWARSLRDQCANARVPFFFKQWGEWAPGSNFQTSGTVAVDEMGRTAADGLLGNYPKDASSADGWEMMHRAGKKAAGALLDGKEYREFPKLEVPA